MSAARTAAPIDQATRKSIDFDCFFSISFSILLVIEVPSSRYYVELIRSRLRRKGICKRDLYDEMAQSLEAKIVVLGSQGVGKTSLVHR